MATIQPVQLTAVGSSVAISVPKFSTNTTIGLQLVVSGTGTYKVEYTLLDPTMNPTTQPNNPTLQRYAYLFPTGVFSTDAPWVDHPVLTGVTTTQVSNVVIPITALRLTCTSYSSGSGTLLIVPGAFP